MIITYLKSLHNYIWYISASLILIVLLAGFVPQREGNYVRRMVSTAVVELAPEDMPTPIINATGWSMRAPVNHQFLSASNAHIDASTHKQLLNFSNNSIALSTTHGAKNVEGNTNFTTLMAALPAEFGPFHNISNTLPVQYGEALGVDGRPIRWAAENSDAHVAKGSYALSCEVEQTSLERVHSSLVARISAPLRNESTYERAKRYRSLVKNAAKRFNLSESLLLAIIQTESNFFPASVSPQSAMGLMQILPSTAGGEVHKYLHGHSATMTLEDLAKPEVNILFGATYMHLLLTRHLGEIKDPEARKYCALAAYNMGPGRLIRFFGEGRDEAIANINSLTAEEVYRRLTTVLPIAETRAYVSKVTSRQTQFEDTM